MTPVSRKFLRALGAASCVAALSSAPRAEGLDPSLAARILARSPAGGAVAERLDGGGTNLSSLTFPTRPSVLFQVRLSGPILGAPIADERGRLLVAHGTGRLTELDARGHTTFTLKVNGELAGAPVLLGSSLAVGLTRDAELFAVSEKGQLVAREKLPFGELEGTFVAAPTSDGGAIMGAGARYARVHARATLVQTGVTDAPLVAVFDWRGSALFVEREGRILARSPALDPIEVGRFGGTVLRAARSGDRLFGLVGEHELVTFDLRTGHAERHFSDPSLELRDFALDARGGTNLVSSQGVLLELDAAGRETSRLALLPDGSGGEATTVVADRAGTVLAVLASAPLLVVTRDGESTTIAGTACPDPLRPTPLSSGVVVVGCRSGVLRGLSDRAR